MCDYTLTKREIFVAAGANVLRQTSGCDRFKRFESVVMGTGSVSGSGSACSTGLLFGSSAMNAGLNFSGAATDLITSGAAT